MNVQSFFDFFVHIDKYLLYIIQSYGILAYLFLFVIVFCETGLVITPFFPGDSLILVAGVFAAEKLLSLWLLFFILIAAAILGDSVNYWLGKRLGPGIFKSNTSKILNKSHLEEAQDFYDRHGGKAIIYARFIPIIRSVAPFVAGIGKMNYSKFLIYNILGGLLWVSLFLFGGYYFGQVPLVKNNLSLVVIIVIVVSLIPVAAEYIKGKRKNK